MASRRPISSFLRSLETAPLFTASKQTPRFIVLRTQPWLSSRHSNPTRAICHPFSTSKPRPDSSEPKTYTFKTLSALVASSESQTLDPHKILIDVREPAELRATGKIPGSINLPLTSSPDFMFLSPEEFEDRYGVARPGKDDEVIFYCKAGVRSRAAARLAQQAGFGGTVSEYPGSWVDWEKSGGRSEKV